MGEPNYPEYEGSEGGHVGMTGPDWEAGIASAQDSAESAGKDYCSAAHDEASHHYSGGSLPMPPGA